MVKVLVCGGRDFNDKEMLNNQLNELHRKINISLIIEGVAKGADTLASQWATDHKIANLRFPALWNRHGKAAGPIRNIRMLEDGSPDLVVAFPGGKGTKHMVKMAKDREIEVYHAE